MHGRSLKSWPVAVRPWSHAARAVEAGRLGRTALWSRFSRFMATSSGRSQAFGALSPQKKTTKTKKDKQVRHAGTFFPAHNSRILVSRTKAIQGPQSKTRRECRCFLIVPTFRGSIFSPFLLFCPFFNYNFLPLFFSLLFLNSIF